MKVLLSILLALCSAVVFAQPQARSSDPGGTKFEVAQAESMIRFLKGVRTRTATPADVDELLAMRGTQLVIQQQNISRTVSQEQYREVLLALIEGREPALKPVNDDARSRNGVKGLTQDVFPALAWGIDHTDLLEARLATVRKIDVGDRAKSLALANLPEPVDFSSRLYVVLGGRAGATALGEDIYFDELITSFRADKGYGSFPEPEKLVEFFAHEMHHVGLGKIIEAKQKSLKAGESQTRGLSLLNSLVLEGSATFLINGHKQLGSLREDRQYRESFEQLPNLQSATRKILQLAVDGKLSQEEYENDVGAFVGSGYHVAGAVMLSAIREANGDEALRAVMRDPRRLPAEYDRAQDKLKTGSAWRFGKQLAEAVARMGE